LPLLLLFHSASSQSCTDHDINCRDWVATNTASCQSTEYIRISCKRSCGTCTGGVNADKRFDMSRLPSNLAPLSWIVGTWRSEHGGKAIFPTIPKFTYGEEITFSIPSDDLDGTKGLNYTAFAWSIGEKDELHSEHGYLAVKPNTREVALTTVMNNGFVTIEEGTIRGQSIKFGVKDIGRISFSRDLPVLDMVREWTLLDGRTLQARLHMETLTHGMQEHTFIRYDKIAP
ncbi:hypothetical protein PFISCL1PPCAC_6085, partial [Pristionchus fissidentatus]